MNAVNGQPARTASTWFYSRRNSIYGVGLRKNEIPGRENDFLRGKLTEVRFVKFL